MSTWSWSIGRLFGIDTRVHASFVLVVVWALFSGYGAGPLALAVGLAFLAAVFASVVAHEFGHALMARSFGVETRQILLLPIGGVAQIEAAHLPPREEMYVALAGPIVSFLLAGTFFTFGAVLGDISVSSFIGGLGWVNLGLALFNLLPAFPMDGGRVLRAILSARIGPLRATEIAAFIGKIAAFGFGAFALLSGRTMLLLLAVFLYLAADQEARLAARRFAPGPRDPRAWRAGSGFSGVDSVRRIFIVRRFWN